MGMLDNARRWMKDRTTSDENIQGTPKDKIRELQTVLGQMTPPERERNIQHVKAYLDYYYIVHQGEKKLPLDQQRDFRHLVEQSNRLSAVELARMVLQQHGGAPTRETIEQSLERPAQQRDKEFSQYRMEPLTSREMSWKDLHPQQEKAKGQKQENSQEQKQARTNKRSNGQGMEVSA